jgi:hypothetical protein
MLKPPPLLFYAETRGAVLQRFSFLSFLLVVVAICIASVTVRRAQCSIGCKVSVFGAKRSISSPLTVTIIVEAILFARRIVPSASLFAVARITTTIIRLRTRT